MFERLRLWWFNICYKHRIPKKPRSLSDANLGPGHHYVGSRCEKCEVEFAQRYNDRQQRFLAKQRKLIAN